jgi:hypothetical protein
LFIFQDYELNPAAVGQIHQLEQGHIAVERPPGLGDPADLPVIALYQKEKTQNPEQFQEDWSERR